MTPGQIQLLQRSLASINPINARIGTAFYDKLFELEPYTRKFKAAGVEPQWPKFMSIFERLVRQEMGSMLTVPVTTEGARELSLPGIAELAQRYVQIGAHPEHFRAARQAFLWSLHTHLGDEFDDATARAWAQAFDMVSESIIRVMRSEATEPALPNDGREVSEDEKYSLETLFQQ